MSQNGVIFSHGIESDLLNLNSGAHAHIGIAGPVGNLVI